MSRSASVFAATLFFMTGFLGTVQAETLAGRVGKVNAAAGEIEIDGTRYKLAHTPRESGGGKPLLSRFQSGDGVVFTAGPGQILLSIEKPAGGVDSTRSQRRGQ